jgi:hypothetical protein
MAQLPALCPGPLCALILLLPAGCLALTPSVARQAIEFGGDIVLTRDAAAGEPPFANDGSVKTCTVNREHGYSLNTPGFADGMAGVNFVKTPASWLNASAVVCHLGAATNATGRPLPSPAGASVRQRLAPSRGCVCQTHPRLRD